MPSLIVVPTPIGNLEDITLRALRVLRESGRIFAEDTRRTRNLLTHYGISKPVTSFHEHNEDSRTQEVLQLLKTEDVVLVSDAGTPAISDPGFKLLKAVADAGIELDVLPGPSALTTAVVAAALPANGFAFLGFLPRKQGERRRKLAEFAEVNLAIVFYEAPHRLVSSLKDALQELGPRPAAVCRELSKMHQEIARGALPDLIEKYSASAPRGEVTVVLASDGQPVDRSKQAVAELHRRLMEGEKRQRAIAAVAARYGVGRNRLYQESLHLPPLASDEPGSGEAEERRARSMDRNRA